MLSEHIVDCPECHGNGVTEVSPGSLCRFSTCGMCGACSEMEECHGCGGTGLSVDDRALDEEAEAA